MTTAMRSYRSSRQRRQTVAKRGLLSHERRLEAENHALRVQWHSL